jgi:hypothetical protein
MTTMTSIAELQHAGVTLDASEAVAIAQQLIRSLREADGRSVEPPYGPPASSNVFLDAAGSVTCRACDTMPAVFDVAIFLDALLPPSPRAPGGLRYAIARAMLAVDVTPFDSMEEFSQTLAKYEIGRREDVVRRLLQRTSSLLVESLPTRERRQSRASVAELRRELREADLRLYQQQIVMRAHVAAPGAPRDRTMLGAALCVAVGVLLFASGELMESRRMPPAVVPPPPPAVVTLPPPEPIETSGRATPVATMPPPAELVSITPAEPSPNARPPLRRSSVKPSSKRPRPPAPATARPSERRSVLDRLHMRWLRAAFRDDP